MTTTEPSLFHTTPLRHLGQRDASAAPPTAADATTRVTAADIAAEDWDLLFLAALELLARVAVEKPTPDGPGARLQAPGTSLRECLDALDQLRRSVPSEQQGQRQLAPQATGGRTRS